MTQKTVTVLALACLLASCLFSASFDLLALAAPSVPFRVEQAAWGTSTTAPIEVEPGDTNVPLTVDVRNLSNETLRGVYGTLQLKSVDPFTDYVTGSYNATASGVPLQVGDVFNQTGDILPAGSFSLTFRLNIARNGVPGHYSYDLMIEYLVKSADNSTWLIGLPQTLTVTILLPNRPPTIDSYSPAAAALTANVGNSLNFTAKCSDPDNDTITYEWELDGTLVSTSSSFNYTPTKDDVGTHTLVLTASDGYLTSSQTWTVTATAVPILHVFLADGYLTAGLENPLNVTLQSNLWKGTVQVSLGVPAPLVIRGNQSWVFNSLEPSGNVSLAARIFAPASAIGSTASGTLTIEYVDEHGQAYTDIYNLGLVVQGYISIIIYDLTISPQTVSSDSEVTITATALNVGNVVASFANASIQQNENLAPSRESIAYVGDIEKNSPVPFTLVAHVNPNVQDGTYPVTINLAYQDDQYRQYSLNITASFVVANSPEPQPNTGSIDDLWSFLGNGGWTIIIMVVVGVVLLILYVRRLSRAKRSRAVSKGENRVVP